ncbi:MAG: portal protein [Rhodospirillales bacterium]
MSKHVSEILTRHERLAGERRLWEQHWQELAEVMLPRRASFTTDGRPGDKRTSNIYDSVPMLARRGLSAAIAGLLRPKTTRWLKIEPADKQLAEDDAVKAWIDDSDDRLFRAIYAPEARFIKATHEVDDDLVTFGSGCLFVGEGRDLNRLLFRSFHLKDCFPAENEEGAIDTMHVVMLLTARQAVQRYGEENVGAKVKEALNGSPKEQDRKFRFIWAVQPREERDAGRRANTDMAFASRIIQTDAEHLVGESGFQEFPFMFPRWDTASGELFGRSPGMLALPDAKTLQAMGKTILVAGQKAADPPLLMPSDSIIGAPRTFPGGNTYYDAEVARDFRGRPPIVPLNTGTNLPITLEMQNATREQVWAAFFKNVFQPLLDKTGMTATEVLERRDEFLRTAGPAFEALEGDYTAPLVERAFNIAQRGGGFLPAPEALNGREVKFKFVSPVEQARKQVEAAGMSRFFELIAPLVQFQPEIMDNLDGDEIVRDAPDVSGMPRRWLRSKGRVEDLRGQRAQAQQAAALLDDAGQAADVARTAAGILGTGQTTQ